jgi:hypothetical protein
MNRNCCVIETRGNSMISCGLCQAHLKSMSDKNNSLVLEHPLDVVEKDVLCYPKIRKIWDYCTVL